MSVGTAPGCLLLPLAYASINVPEHHHRPLES
jgi:hypothetical protein